MNPFRSWLPESPVQLSMTKRNRRRLELEQLEDRSTPTVLSLFLDPTTIIETAGPGAVLGMVTRSETQIDQPLTVQLQSSDTTEATVPASVTIDAGQTSATFTVNIIDDTLLDGTQNVTITATAAGSGPATVGLDSTFGVGGYRVLPNHYTAWSSNIPDIKQQADGKVLIATDSNLAAPNIWALSRTLADGTLDTSFGTNGTVHTTFAGATDSSHADGIAVQPDGKIIVIGNITGSGINGSWGVARYNSNGTLDTTFGELVGGTIDRSGIKRLTFNGSGGWPYDVALTTNGEILVTGVRFGATATSFSVARLTSNGDLDLTFGVDGVASISMDGTNAAGSYAMALQSDGKIVLAGRVTNNGFGVARFNANGTADTTFGTGGRTVVSRTLFNSAGVTYTQVRDGAGLGIQADGKIVVGGTLMNSSQRFDMAAFRLNANGTLDTGFAGDGTVTVDFGGLDDTVNDLAIQSDGRIILAGQAFLSGNGHDSALVRLNSNGTLDTTFDSDGKWTAPPLASTFEKIWAIDLAGSDKVLALVAYGADVRAARINVGLGAISTTANLSVTDNETRPVAVNDSFEMFENETLNIPAPGVLNNDYDEGLDPLTAVLASGPAHGQLTFNSDGSFTYTPDANWFGTDTFTYRASDGNLQSTPATVSIKVNAVNIGGPTGSDDTFTVSEDGVLTIFNTPPVEGAGVTSLTMVSDKGDYIGQGLTYSYSPSTGTFSANRNFDNGVSLSYSESGIGGHWWYLDFAAPFNETLVPRTYLNATRFPFQADNVPGLSVSGDGRGSNTLTGQFTVTQALFSETGQVLRYGATFEQHSEGAVPALRGEIRYNYWTGALIPAGVLVNDSDPDGDVLTAQLVSGPAHGTLTFNTDGTFTYRPTADYNGTDSFTYRPYDGVEYGNVTTVTINVTPKNDAPVGAADSYTLDEDTPLTVNAPGVLANDSDIDGTDTLTAVLYSAPTKGQVTLNANGSFTYTPNANYVGADSFRYRVFDGTTYSAPVTVNLTVRPVNDAPVANPDAYSVDEDQTLTLAGIVPPTGAGQFKIDMVSDKGDYIGQGLTYNFTSTSGTYTASRNFDNGVSIRYGSNDGQQNWSYDFAAPFNATLTPGNYLNATRWPFQADNVPGLSVTGNSRGSNTLTGQFTVTQALYAADGTVLRFGAIFEQHSEGAVPALRGELRYNYWAGNLLPAVMANDTDVDNDVLNFILVSGPSNGSVTVNPDGTINYTPNANFNGTDTFTYKVSDGVLESAVVPVTITVNAKPDAPIAAADSYSLDEDTTLTTTPATGVLANDSDPDGGPITAALVAGPANGALTLNPDGSFIYTPNANFNGADSFSYQATDGTLSSSTVTVSLSVRPVNDAPVANAGDDVTADEGGSVAFSGAGSSDPDGDPLTYLWDFGDGTNGSGATPSHVYTDNGSYTVRLTVNDGQGGTAIDELIVTVRTVAPTPSASGGTTGVRGQERSFTFSATDPSLADTNAGFTYRIEWGDGAIETVSGPASGVQRKHTWTASGDYTLRVTATDKDGASATAERTVSITAVAIENGNLIVGGTTGGERITLRPGNTTGGVRVQIAGADLGVYQPTGDVIVYGQAGNDIIELLSTKITGTTYRIANPAYLFGGDGDDTLDARGVTTGAVLVAGDGIDTLYGSTGRDLLIGGLGADVLRGDNGEDILIGGNTIYDNDLSSLKGMRSEWVRTDVNASTRRTHLTDPQSGGLNGSAVLTNLTILDDLAIDDLYGDNDGDWFLRQLGTNADRVRDQKPQDIVTGL